MQDPQQVAPSLQDVRNRQPIWGSEDKGLLDSTVCGKYCRGVTAERGQGLNECRRSRVKGQGQVQGSRFRIQELWFRVSGLGFRVQALSFRLKQIRLQALGFRLWGLWLGLRIQDVQFSVHSLRLKVLGLHLEESGQIRFRRVRDRVTVPAIGLGLQVQGICRPTRPNDDSLSANNLKYTNPVLRPVWASPLLNFKALLDECFTIGEALSRDQQWRQLKVREDIFVFKTKAKPSPEIVMIQDAAFRIRFQDFACRLRAQGLVRKIRLPKQQAALQHSSSNLDFHVYIFPSNSDGA